MAHSRRWHAVRASGTVSASHGRCARSVVGVLQSRARLSRPRRRQGLFFTVFVRRAPVVFAAILTVASSQPPSVWALAGKIDPSLFEDGFRKARLREPGRLLEPARTSASRLAFPWRLWVSRSAPSSRSYVRPWRWASLPHRSGDDPDPFSLGCACSVGGGRSHGSPLRPAGSRRSQPFCWPCRQAWRWGSGLSGSPASSTTTRSSPCAPPMVERLGWLIGLLFCRQSSVVALGPCDCSRSDGRSRRRATPPRALRVVAWLAVAIAIAGLILFVVRAGNPVSWVGDKLDEFTGPDLVSNDPSRFSSVELQLAARLVGRSGQCAFKDEPALGTGAGTFPVVHRLYRDTMR